MSNTARVIAKTRLEVLADIVNRSANEAHALQEFHWLLVARLEHAEAVEGDDNSPQLPHIYVVYASSKKFAAEMWQRYKDHGVCLDSAELRTLERRFNAAADA